MSAISSIIKYIIFDVDGVLVNTFPVSARAALTVLKGMGINLKPCDLVPYIGTGEANFISQPCKSFGKPDEIEQGIKDFYRLFEEFISKDLQVFESVHYVLETLAKSPYRLAIASSSAKDKLEKTLAAAKIDLKAFEVIISGSDVSERKPSPQIYQSAISALGAEPSECLVVEDAISGVVSAKTAGCRCFAVTNSFSKQTLLEAGADMAAGSLRALLD